MDTAKKLKKKICKTVKKHPKSLLCLFVVVLMFLLWLIWTINIPTTSQINIVSVGKANCVIIQSGHNVWLYNAAEDKNSNRAIQEYLEYRDITHIDGIILANNKSKNLNKAQDLIDKYNIRNIYMSSFGDNNKYYKNLLSYIESRSYINVHYPHQGDKITLDRGAIDFIQSNKIYKTVEDASLCIRYKDDYGIIVYGLGDITPIAEKDVIKKLKSEESNGKFTIKYVIASNNGVGKTTTKDFLEAAESNSVIVSNTKASKSLEKDVESLQGIIQLTADKSNIEILSTKGGSGVSSSTTIINKTDEEIKQERKDDREKKINKYEYVGNSNVHLYYKHDDPIIKTIEDCFIMYFTSAEEAQSEGYEFMPTVK